MLTGSIFMLEIYDRVLPSRSVPTLIGLIVLAGGLYVAHGVLDLIRGRILVRIGASARRGPQRPRLRHPGPPAAEGRQAGDGLQPLRDLDNVRTFLSGGAGRALRSAVDAALSRDLLCVPPTDRP